MTVPVTIKSPSIRQPHWHRHLDVKRPTLTCDLRRVVRSQSAVWRQPVKLDYFRVADNSPVDPTFGNRSVKR